MSIPNYNLPMLTLEKFTAVHALEAHVRKTRSVDSLHTPEAPWGGQCTDFLKDGTPVDGGFVAAVLRHLTGNAKAASDYIQKWEAHIRKTCDYEGERIAFTSKPQRRW